MFGCVEREVHVGAPGGVERAWAVNTSGVISIWVLRGMSEFLVGVI